MRRLCLALVAVLAVLGSAGCANLPDSGAVHRQAADRPDRPQDAPYFNPPGPAKDGSPAAIVSGFLTAMQANPLSTSVARSFLSAQARSEWRPNRGTLVYEASTVVQTSTGATVRLADTRRLDARGGWQGDGPGRTQTLDLALVSENGQWRIDNPVDALVVPTSFFDRSFSRFNLFFYDQTGRVLLPDPVFIPRGEQSATNLVRGLLAGPGSSIADVSRSALPSRTGLDLSVIVTESGVAEVPLSRELLEASPQELTRAVDQLARTLRQVPDIERVRITVGGAPVPLPGGGIDAPVTAGSQYDAAGPSDAALWGLRSGRIEDLQSPSSTVEGPLGRAGYSLRSFAAGEDARQVAGVTSDGRSLVVAPARDGAADPVTRPVSGARDLLRPSYDIFGDLWVVDRGPRGARVLVVHGTSVRELRLPGVTGTDVAAFSVARDGSRVAVAYAGSPAPSVRVTDLLRTDEGLVSGAGSTRTFSAVGGDATRIVDVGWRDPATIAVLSRPSAETSQVSYVSSDGSPVSPTLTEPSVFRGAADAMVVSPDAALPLRLITPDQRLYTLSGGGSWPRTSSKVGAAAYVR